MKKLSLLPEDFSHYFSNFSIIINLFFQTSIILVLALAFFLTPARAKAESLFSLRGAEQEEAFALDPLRNTVSAATYLPRQLLNGTLYGAGHAAAKLSDKDFIRKVKDILYLYDEKILWYPIIHYASGFRPAYGIGLRFADEGWKISSKNMIHDSNYSSFSLKPSYQWETPVGPWTNSVLAVIEKKDDQRFYGIGSDPRDDSRNTFVGSEDYGVYTETRKKIQWESSLYNQAQSLGITYLGFYQRRSFEDHGRGNRDVREMFDHSRIPGFDQPARYLYNELAAEWDTRNQQKIISPGFRSEIYSGIAAGIGGNTPNLYRAGFDAAGFIPVLKDDRVFIPRVVGDLVKNLQDAPIPFSEYPRHHTFRGASRREIIRSENISLVPSLEYRWPLSHMFAGHIFVDTLFVGPRAGKIRWNDGIWAAGVGMDFHLFKNELVRTELALGSEGFQAMITFGVPLKSNHRKDW